MGGFFVSNAPDAARIAQASFAAKPLRFAGRRSAGQVEVLHWAKLNDAAPAAVYEDASGWILGCGTFSYRDRFGPACLQDLWRDTQRDFRAFGEVLGHFSFLVYRDGKLHAVMDKTGTYHVHIAEDGEHFYLSTSMLALADCLPKLTLGKQEVLELINTETTFGHKTVFEEVRYADAGVVIECAPSLPQRRYYQPRDERVTFDELVERYDRYCVALKHTGFMPCCDLSGGHDTRTVAAVLAHAGVEVAYNTNENTADPNDQRTAERIAALLKRPVKVYPNGAREHDPAKLVSDCFDALELARNIHRSAYMPVYFAHKGRDFPMIIGGYGGELLRDKYSRPSSLDELIRSFYVSSYIWMRSRVYRGYRAHLSSKFERRLRELGETDIKKGCEKIYYFEKMRFWGGSRITAASQYNYSLHPLLDHALARHAFDFSLADKAGAGLQKRVMALVPGLEAIPINQLARPRDPVGLAVYYLRTRLHMPMPKDLPPDARRIWRRLRTRGHYRAPEALARATQTPISAALAHSIDMPIEHLGEAALLGRFATVARALERYEGKVRGL